MDELFNRQLPGSPSPELKKKEINLLIFIIGIILEVEIAYISN
jgi:hypothetical protein